jgi:hypothetical protein
MSRPAQTRLFTLLLLWMCATYDACVPCSAGQCGITSLGCRAADPGFTCSNCCSNSSCYQIPCVAGTYCPGGTGEIDCPAGKWSSANSSVCTNCTSGTFNLNPRSNSSAACISCAAGTWSSAGSPFCTNCTAGTWSSAESPSCTNCSAGTSNPYSRSTSVDACTFCEPGQYSSSGAPSCSECQAGRYNPNSNQSSCTLCTSVRFLCFWLHRGGLHLPNPFPPTPASARDRGSILTPQEQPARASAKTAQWCVMGPPRPVMTLAQSLTLFFTAIFAGDILPLSWHRRT